jgi:hypothetical protein
MEGKREVAAAPSRLYREEEFPPPSLSVPAGTEKERGERAIEERGI